MGRAHRKTAKPIMSTGPSTAQKQIAKTRGETSFLLNPFHVFYPFPIVLDRECIILFLSSSFPPCCNRNPTKRHTEMGQNVLSAQAASVGAQLGY